MPRYTRCSSSIWFDRSEVTACYPGQSMDDKAQRRLDNEEIRLAPRLPGPKLPGWFR